MMLLRLMAAAASLLAVATTLTAADPIRLHPKNPHYFEWRGKALALITSAEHYGMVLNPDLDFKRYLETLGREGMNYTRIFSGSYVEPRGAFSIKRNNLAPGQGRFLSPWARSGEQGYAGGGNKFDLDRWDPDYLARLKGFIAEAGRHGIVVELTLFCSTYGDSQWSLSPFHPSNNVDGISLDDWKRLNTLVNGSLFTRQERLVRHLVRELNGFDNLFYEIQNEPWADNHVMGDFLNPYLHNQKRFPNAVEVTTPVSVEWQAAIAKVIVDEESRLPHRHLIAQNIANFRLPVRDNDIAAGVSILNFHYAFPEAAAWNYGLGRLLGYDESGFAGSADGTYRREAWNFMMAGGGLFNSLDYSFTQGREDGTDTEPNGPGGGSPALRRQLGTLSRFLHSFDLAELRPDVTSVRVAQGTVARGLSSPGKQYAFYLAGRAPARLLLDLPRGRYGAEWLNPVSGKVERSEELDYRGGTADLVSPLFEEEIALRIVIKR